MSEVICVRCALDLAPDRYQSITVMCSVRIDDDVYGNKLWNREEQKWRASIESDVRTFQVPEECRLYHLHLFIRCLYYKLWRERYSWFNSSVCRLLSGNRKK